MQAINLLPQELRKDPMVEIRRVLRKATISAILGIFVVALVTLYINNYFKQMEIQSFETEIAEMQPLVQKVNALKQEIAVNTRKINTYQLLLNQPVWWPDMLKDIAFNLPRDIWLNEITSFDVETPEVKDKDGKVVSAARTAKFLSLRGYTQSLDSIGVLLLHLNQIPTLSEVQLIIAREPEGKTRNTFGFYVLEFEIKAKVDSSATGGKSYDQ